MATRSRSRAKRRQSAKADPLVPIDPEKLDALRRRAGLTLRELAGRAGTVHSKLSTIANGRHKNRPRRIKRVRRSLRRRLARVLGVDVLYLELPGPSPARAFLAQSDYLDAVARALVRETGVEPEVRPADNHDGLVIGATGEPLLEMVLPEAWADDWGLFQDLMNPRLWEGFFNQGPQTAWTDEEFEEAVLATIGALRVWLRPWLEGRSGARTEAIAALVRLLRATR